MLLQLKQFKQKLFSDFDSVPESLSKKYYPSMDGLRGLAIVSVVLRHASLNSDWGYWIDGTLGIQIFFIISGFLITTLLLKERVEKGKVSLKNFYIRRTLRIFPVAYLFILILIILSRIFHFELHLKSILTAVFYLKNFPIASEWYTGHFWSLSVEEQFYLLAPFVLVTNPNRYIKLLVLMFILVPVADYIGFNNIGIFYSVRWVHVILFTFLAAFDQGTLYILVGSLFSILIFKRILVVERFKNHYFLSTICFVLALVIHFARLVVVVPYLSASVFAILVAFVIAINLYENNFLTKILGHPLMVKLGILSYSLYIWQQIFTINQPWAHSFKYGDSIVLNLVALFITASCSYYFFELKFLKIKKRFK